MKSISTGSGLHKYIGKYDGHGVRTSHVTSLFFSPHFCYSCTLIHTKSCIAFRNWLPLCEFAVAQVTPINQVMFFLLSIGPVGSAICVYNAENTYDPDTTAGGFGEGIFDIFRGDLRVEAPDGTVSEEQNNFVQVGEV